MTILGVLLLAAGCVAAAPSGRTYERHNQHRTPAHYVVPRAPAMALAAHTLPLERRPASQPRPRPWDDPARGPLAVHSSTAAPAPAPNGTGGGVAVGFATAANHAIEYVTRVGAGANNLSLVVDTGSSDTWFVQAGFTCVNPQYREPVRAAQCDFGPAFEGGFPGGAIADQHLSVSYGSDGGPFIQGRVGYSDVTVAGLTTKKQLIGLATRGYWQGDGVTSGLLGLGLPGLTNAFPGSAAYAATLAGTLADARSAPIPYSPLVTTLAARNNVTQFSLALARDPGASFLALGGAPPHVAVDAALGWVTTPVVKTFQQNALGVAVTAPAYMYYSIAVERLRFNSSLLARSATVLGGEPIGDVPVVVDSGTTLNLFSFDVAEAINQLFVPHAQFDPDQGAWFVRCDATPPSLGVQIGGRTIWTDPRSMILPPSAGLAGTNICMTGVGARGSAPYILGDTFLQQLVTVFDVAKKEIKFAKRLPDAGTGTGQAAAGGGNKPW